jgi:hypothetical protein
MNVLSAYSNEQNCTEVDFEIVQMRKKDDCLAAYKECGKSEAQKVDTSRGCEMVYLKKLCRWVALLKANTARNVNKKVKLCACTHTHIRVRVHVSVRADVHACMYVLYICMYACISICMCVCTYVCM